MKKLKGVFSKGDPPLPIPNREVKPFHADGTANEVGEQVDAEFQESQEIATLFLYLYVTLLSHKLRVYIFERTLTAQVFLRQFAYKIELVASQLKHAILLRQTFLEY